MSRNIITNVSYSDFYFNCVYSSVAKAIFSLREPFYAYSQSWDKNNYCFHYGRTRGTISFYADKNIVVGAARDERSNRRKWYPEYDAVNLFDFSSNIIQMLAMKDSLEYLYDEENGITKPMASIGFWIEKNNLCSRDNKNDFLCNGGEYIEIISQNLSDIKEFWKNEYELSNLEIKTIDHIFRSVKKNRLIDLNEIKDVLNIKCNGYDECMESLKELEVTIK